MSKYKRRIYGRDNFVRHMKFLVLASVLGLAIVVVFPIKWWHG